MALRNQPYIPLYVQDYLTDEKLNACCPASQGVYIKIICVLHKSEPYGTILLKQKDKQNSSNILNFACKFAKNLPFTVEVIESALLELIDEGVMTLDGDTLYQKRMVRDNELSEKRASAGFKGGQARLKKEILLKQKAKQNASKKPSKTQANSEYEYVYENENENIDKSEKKHKYGTYENVLLSDENFQKLVNEFPGDYQERIESLSEYIASKGAKYKDHLATIRSWARKDKAKPSGNPFKDKLKEMVENEQNGSSGAHVGYQGGLSKLLQEPNRD